MNNGKRAKTLHYQMIWIHSNQQDPYTLLIPTDWKEIEWISRSIDWIFCDHNDAQHTLYTVFYHFINEILIIPWDYGSKSVLRLLNLFIQICAEFSVENHYTSGKILLFYYCRYYNQIHGCPHITGQINGTMLNILTLWMKFTHFRNNEKT